MLKFLRLSAFHDFIDIPDINIINRFNLPPSFYRLILLDTYDWRLWNNGIIALFFKKDLVLINKMTGKTIEQANQMDIPDSLNSINSNILKNKVNTLIGVRKLIIQFTYRLGSIQQIKVKFESGQIKNLYFARINKPYTYQNTNCLLFSDDLGKNVEKQIDNKNKKIKAMSPVDMLSNYMIAKADHFLNHRKIMLRRNGGFYLSARHLLMHLTESMTQNEQGILRNIDSECLHDYRVSLRKLRTFLKLTDSYYQKKNKDKYLHFFKKLNSLTSPVRDLDVFFLNKTNYQQLLPKSYQIGLDIFYKKLQKKYVKVQKNMVLFLKSEKYKNFINYWKNHIKKMDNNQIIELEVIGREIINNQYIKILDKCKTIPQDWSQKKLHKLRIDYKTLRYFFEFFQNIFSKEIFKPIQKKFKNIQDDLGIINDFYNQMSQLKKYIRAKKKKTKPNNILAPEKLITILHQEQKKKIQAILIKIQNFKKNNVTTLQLKINSDWLL